MEDTALHQDLSQNDSPGHETWQQQAGKKRDNLMKQIPQQWRLPQRRITHIYDSTLNLFEHTNQHLSPLEVELTTTPLPKLASKLRSGDVTCYEVTTAFCHRASLASQFTRSMSEICFKQALEQAEELDDYFNRNNAVVGPLHGIPITVKDRFHVSGLASASGFVAWLDKVRTHHDEGTLIRILRRAGCIIIGKTSVPMSLLIGETISNILGTTVSPYNHTLSAGGASGGEAVQIAMYGSGLGWGSDIAGSIRIPCNVNGVFGLKPSSGRLPHSGMTNTLPGMPVAQFVPGPIGRDIDSLILAMTCVLNAEPWKDDHDVVCMPWRQHILDTVEEKARYRVPNITDTVEAPEVVVVEDQTKVVSDTSGKCRGLIFAIQKWDRRVMPHPPVLRAIESVRQALLLAGHEVVDWDPPSHARAVKNLFEIIGSTSGENIRATMDAAGEPPIPQLSNWYNDKTRSTSLTSDFWNLCHERDQYRKHYHDYWDSRLSPDVTPHHCEKEEAKPTEYGRRMVDGVIMPVSPLAAIKPETNTYHDYSAIANVLDYTALSFPVTYVDKNIDLLDTKYQPINEFDETNMKAYDVEMFHGCPVGLQLMCRRLEEEKTLGLTKIVMAALQACKLTRDQACSY